MARLGLNLSLDLIKDNVPAEVVPGIYLGSLHAALNQEALHERGITHIANLSGLPATFPKHFNYLTIEVNDNKASDILTCIPATNIFLESALEGGGKVLVHCYGGRSRSPAVIIAYLMSTCGHSYDKALATVVAARSVVALNTGFEMQLRAYGASTCDVYSAHQLMLQSRLLTISRAKRRRSAIVFNAPDMLRLVSMSPLVTQDGTTIGSTAPMLSSHPRSRTPTDDTADDAATDEFGKKPEPVSIPKLCMPIRQVAMLRLSKPGAKSVQVIPPLQGLELDFKCKACSATLFQASSILRHLPGKSPMISRDLSWMYPAPPSPSDDDLEEDDGFQVSDAPSTEVSGLHSSTSLPPLVQSFPTVSFGDFGSPRKETVAPEASFPVAKPMSATLGKLGPKSKSFAVRSGVSSGPSSFDPFDFGSGVPPTPSNRLGRGKAAPAPPPKPQPKVAFASPIHESVVEEEDGDSDSSDDEKAQVVDESASFDVALGTSTSDAPGLLSFPTLSTGFGSKVGQAAALSEAAAVAPMSDSPRMRAIKSLSLDVAKEMVDTVAALTVSPISSEAGGSSSSSIPQQDAQASDVVPISARGMTAEKSRFLEKMRWLEEAGLEPGVRRTDEEVVQVSGGTGSAALTRRGLRRIRRYCPYCHACRRDYFPDFGECDSSVRKIDCRCRKRETQAA